jgi:16S rRNA processing protein RimM
VIVSETDFADARFQVGARVFARRDGQVHELTVAESRVSAGHAVVGFAGVASIDDAEVWRGTELRIPAAALHELPPDAYYAHDLVGCEIRTVAGAVVGVVARVDFGAGAPLLVVAGDRGEVLVPLVDRICRHVDLAARAIVIEPPDGLLDVNVLKKDRPR